MLFIPGGHYRVIKHDEAFLHPACLCAGLNLLGASSKAEQIGTNHIPWAVCMHKFPSQPSVFQMPQKDGNGRMPRATSIASHRLPSIITCQLLQAELERLSNTRLVKRLSGLTDRSVQCGP